MAKTFETYARLRDENATTHRPLEDRIDGAVELTELLQDVRRRVTEFVHAYEAAYDMELGHIVETRGAEDYKPESRRARVADNMELDLQSLSGLPGARLLLDDVKILLEKFPQTDI